MCDYLSEIDEEKRLKIGTLCDIMPFVTEIINTTF